MNELIKRLAVITVCVIVLAAAGIFIYAEVTRDTPAAVELPTETVTASETSANSDTETTAASVTVKTTAEAAVSETDGRTAETTAPTAETEEETTKSRTIITSRVRKEYDNNSVYIDMENILQLPELPVGCEITALTILLRYCGFDADKVDLAKNYLPTSWGNPRYEDGKTYKDSFFDYFIGDPFSRGYGCFSGAIEKAANDYISANGGGFTVKNISGSHPDVLYDYLAAGTPVLCWATDGMIEPEYYETWYDNATGEQLDWYLNEHCFVLAGFNMDADLVTLNDPMKGIIDYNINKFETRYDQMHRQAIVILPNGTNGAVGGEVTETAETAGTSETYTETEDTKTEQTENTETEQTEDTENIEDAEEL